MGFQTQCGFMGLSYHLKGDHKTNVICTCLWLEAILTIELEISSLRIAIEAHMPIFNESRRINTQHVEMMQRHRKVAFDKQHGKHKLIPNTLVML